MKLFRAQRNFYITGISLFLLMWVLASCLTWSMLQVRGIWQTTCACVDCCWLNSNNEYQLSIYWHLTALPISIFS
jgi:hypothetical protein